MQAVHRASAVLLDCSLTWQTNRGWTGQPIVLISQWKWSVIGTKSVVLGNKHL